MLPIHKIIYFEMFSQERPERVSEKETMNDLEQIRSYVKAYEWGGPTSALQLHHLKELSLMINDGDTIVDLACGPGPLLLELAVLYPESQFIGVDMAPLMLSHLQQTAESKNLKNILIFSKRWVIDHRKKEDKKKRKERTFVIKKKDQKKKRLIK